MNKRDNRTKRGQEMLIIEKINTSLQIELKQSMDWRLLSKNKLTEHYLAVLDRVLKNKTTEINKILSELRVDANRMKMNTFLAKNKIFQSK